MEKEWEPIQFDIISYKNTGTYILKCSEDTSQMLDDHIVMTQSMSFSPFKKAFESRIGNWESKLQISQVILLPCFIKLVFLYLRTEQVQKYFYFFIFHFSQVFCN